ncbi:MAG: hypothetical protein DRJ35_02175 [Thermoprotei archaeon]|nr:MAG: hypothetical protein DRJ35_02175 [Thermoprotei archaeon]
MDDFLRLLYWVDRIGMGEKSLVEISRNSRKAHEVLEKLRGYGLVNVRRKGKMYLITLSDQGLEVYEALQRLKRKLGFPTSATVPKSVFARESFASAPSVIGGRFEEPEPLEPSVTASEEGLPSFARDNPWLAVLVERGRKRVGV